MLYLRKTHPWRREAVSFEAESKIDHDSCGKWVIFGVRSYIGNLFREIRKLIEKDELYYAKFVKGNRAGKYALLVYADERTKQATLEKLINLGVRPRHWISNSYTRAHFG